MPAGRYFFIDVRSTSPYLVSSMCLYPVLSWRFTVLSPLIVLSFAIFRRGCRVCQAKRFLDGINLDLLVAERCYGRQLVSLAPSHDEPWSEEIAEVLEWVAGESSKVCSEADSKLSRHMSYATLCSCSLLYERQTTLFYQRIKDGMERHWRYIHLWHLE